MCVSGQCFHSNFYPFILASLYKKQSLSLRPYPLNGLLSLSYVGAMVSSNGALAYISYPTQVTSVCLSVCLYVAMVYRGNDAYYYYYYY